MKKIISLTDKCMGLISGNGTVAIFAARRVTDCAFKGFFGDSRLEEAGAQQRFGLDGKALRCNIAKTQVLARP